MESQRSCGSGSMVRTAKRPGTPSPRSSTYDIFDKSVCVSLGLGHISVDKNDKLVIENKYINKHVYTIALEIKC